MHPDRKAELKEKQKQANQKLLVKEFLAATVDPALEMIASIPDIRIEVSELLYVKPEWEEILKSAFNEPPYLNFRFADVPYVTGAGRLSDVLESFGDTLSLRYVPNLPAFANQPDEKDNIIARLSAHLRCDDEYVFLHHLQYAIVWKILLSELIRADHPLLFNSYNGDAVVFSKNNAWLMSYSLEEQWYAGRKNPPEKQVGK